MTQAPMSVKLALPSKGGIAGRPGLVQVLQTTPVSSVQDIGSHGSPVFKTFTTVRPFLQGSAVQMNTNTAIQYVRKPPEMTVINPGSTFVATPMNQPFAPYGGSIMTISPNLMQSLSGPTSLNPNTVGQLSGSSALLSNLANSRKPCNCTKSHCLKLYCECFAQGQLCQNCNCNNCMNNLAYEEERGRAIKMTLERNPTAFHPKIGRGEGERKHTKGCNCKRSGCLKNYCECYEAKISCSDLCRCQGCRNTEDSVERRSLMRLAAMGSLRSRQPASFKKHLIKQPPETMPHMFFTWEVIEATACCLLAQAEETERRDLPPAAQERIILEEFGRILENVIDSASKAQVRSASSIQAPDSEGEQSILHTSAPVYGIRASGTGAIGAATAAAAAADVLLRNDEEDDEQIMRDTSADDEDDDPGDLDDDMFDDEELGHGGRSSHSLRHTREPPSRRALNVGSRASRTHVTELMEEAISDDEDSFPEDISVRHPSTASHLSQKYRQSMSNRHRSHIAEGRYHSRRNASGGRSHEHHDPDSVI
ncbi:hypothetical protein EG68_04806 [Paragonimus skrjabini miyazakii]|uniref:CRC domain-containing protein n=1 Tax=Paragonimus skrjabini miyazakii TaxID=59628 RepID=A0A8S9YTL6_9TREM|nr:hypothetical protein EG68_04806 [Paragonimus skrjabini miyazakii]